MATETQWENMNSGAVRYSIFAREEDFQAHDDENMRRYYQQWGKLMGQISGAPLRRLAGYRRSRQLCGGR